MLPILYDNGLVCEPLGNPHYHHHHVNHVRFISYLKPTIRHHAHHVRVCHHGHAQHCHWELGGPAGGYPYEGYGFSDYGGLYDSATSGEAGGYYSGAPDIGGDIWFGLGPKVLGSVGPITPSIIQPVAPPMVAVPEVPVPAMLMMGFAAMFAVSLFRKRGLLT